jgi:hypothetical protein
MALNEEDHVRNEKSCNREVPCQEKKKLTFLPACQVLLPLLLKVATDMNTRSLDQGILKFDRKSELVDRPEYSGSIDRIPEIKWKVQNAKCEM